MRTSTGLPQWAHWLIAGLALVLGIGLLFASPTGETLDCNTGPQGWSCEHQTHLRFQAPRTRHFAATNTAGIEFVEYNAGKNNRREMGRIEVFDGRGAPLQIFDTTRYAAREYHEQLDAFVTGAGAESLHIEQRPTMAGLGPSLALFAAAVVMFVMGRGGTDTSAAPAAVAETPAPTNPHAKMQRRVMFGVLGTVLGLGAVFTVVELLHQRGKAWVHVKCVHRCKVEGMDCRPPGEVGSWQSPGTYTVQAYDPDAPGGWTDVSIELAEGDNVTLECKPPG